jgi:hypothetical protein
VGTEFAYSEFINSHDLYLSGNGTKFHHNWIHNLNDEALFLDGAAVAAGVLHDNVITRTLSAISFAGSNSAGPWQIYRNLIDLRQPTAGYRPRHVGFNGAYAWRYGRPFKSEENPPSMGGVPRSDGPYDVFQNTFIVGWQAARAGDGPQYPQLLFDQFRGHQEPRGQRRSLNNIFVVLNREPDRAGALAFLPSADFPADMNGNLYYQHGFTRWRLFYVLLPAPSTGFSVFGCDMGDCLAQWRATPFFLQSQSSRYPGFEANSLLLVDPQFTNWTGEETSFDDFRLGPSSPARAGGVPLPMDLKPLDKAAPQIGAPDIGSYQTQPTGAPALKLRVGVRGRRVYPENGPGQ